MPPSGQCSMNSGHLHGEAVGICCQRPVACAFAALRYDFRNCALPAAVGWRVELCTQFRAVESTGGDLISALCGASADPRTHTSQRTWRGAWRRSQSWRGWLSCLGILYPEIRFRDKAQHRSHLNDGSFQVVGPGGPKV